MQYMKSYEPVFVVRFVFTQDLFGGLALDGLIKFNVFNQMRPPNRRTMRFENAPGINITVS